MAYDAFYKNSANRPKERNGYGFVSSWWNENSDENVYYTINLDENYAPYQASYRSLNSIFTSDMMIAISNSNTNTQRELIKPISFTNIMWVEKTNISKS